MSIPSIDFAPCARKVPQIGFGCGRLVGRSNLRASSKLVEAALDLGIRYFDVAPCYGGGTAEEVIGAVVGNSREAVVTSKVGIPRPAYQGGKNTLRLIAKPILDRARGLKTLARRFYAPKPAPSGAARPRYDYSDAFVRASLDESLRLLRRDRLDLYLAHDAQPPDLTPALAATMQELVSSGRVGAFGAGVEDRSDRWSAFGQVWQSAWPGDAAFANYANDTSYIFHGVIRLAPKDRSGRTLTPAGQLVGRAMRLAPRSIILISTSTPRQLRELVQQALDAAAREPAVTTS